MGDGYWIKPFQIFFNLKPWGLEPWGRELTPEAGYGCLKVSLKEKRKEKKDENEDKKV